jgi:2-methylcitrate dehydratase PrpD
LEITATLARFIAESRWDDIPAPVRHEAKRTLLNFLGTALGGCRDEAIEHLVAVLAPLAGPAQASLLGRRERLDMLSAAFVNGAAGNVHDFDDTHLPTVIHPAAPVVPVLLSLAETRQVSGVQVLHALILGLEAECRLGNAVTPYHYAHGWHITSTCGVVGAAAAAAKVLGLDAGKTVNALGLAANQAAGLIEGLGTMAKSVTVGAAPRNGLFSALLAERGYACSPQMLEGPRGFARVMGDKPDFDAITGELGRRWESSRNTYKPYPCGIVLHPVIDAFLELRKQVPAGEVSSIVVRGNPLLRQRTDRPNPRSGREAQVSIHHTAAVCFLHGAAGLAQYSDAAVSEPAVRAFGNRVEIVDDATLPVEGARVVVRTTAGREIATEVRAALGSRHRPMTDAQLEAKACELARLGAPGVDMTRVVDGVWNLENTQDCGAFVHISGAP